jgi:hypothetical protein
MKYYILVRDNKIINAGYDCITKIEYDVDGQEIIHSSVADVRAKYENINEKKTYNNIYIGGNNSVLHLYTE